MTNNRSQSSSRNTARTERKAVTFEMAAHLCPHEALADNLARTFGFDAVDSAGIREATEEHLALTARALKLSDKALEIHLQRIVGAYVGSAFGSGQFYSTKVSAAIEASSSLSKKSSDATSPWLRAARTEPLHHRSLPV